MKVKELYIATVRCYCKANSLCGDRFTRNDFYLSDFYTTIDEAENEYNNLIINMKDNLKHYCMLHYNTELNEKNIDIYTNEDCGFNTIKAWCYRDDEIEVFIDLKSSLLECIINKAEREIGDY